MSNFSISDIMKFFLDVSNKAFSRTTAGYISKFGPMKKVTAYALMVLRLAQSVFPSERLEEGLKTFFDPETSLFAPALHSQPSITRVAVTSAKDLGQTACLITNYNYPRGNAANNLEREEDSGKDMKIWEAALATSAAPFYLPPFEKKETYTQYIDGGVYASCPAEVAYGEMEKLWPEHGVSLDLLVSLGTGEQRTKDTETPALANIRFSASMRAMFERQRAATHFWTTFQQQTAPRNIIPKLYRLDPALKGDHVGQYDNKRLQELSDAVTEWNKTVAAAQIQKVANALIASLFFFEPNDLGAVDSYLLRQSYLSDPTYGILRGSIRCRLSHGSQQLEKLLGEMVEGFYYAQMTTDNTADEGDRIHPWTEIQLPPGHNQLVEVMVSESQSSGHTVKKFRLPFNFIVKNHNSKDLFQVLAVKLKRSESKIAISGFPATLADLQRRSKIKWLL
jgi:predicted acylesterase/phospholipase RssA